MSEHSGDRQTGSHDSEEASDTDGGVHDSHGDEAEASEREHGTEAGESTGEGVSEELRELLAALADDGVTARAIEDGIVDPATMETDETLNQQVEETASETVAHALAVLGETLARLDAEVREERERTDDLESRLRRKQADFQNYKRRQKERMAEEKQRATEDLVERLLDVRDNLERALDTDEDADIRSGIESTLSQFDRELDRENVESIDPEPGGGVDPVRHEVLATVPSAEPEDTIADIHRPGYEMAGKVLRPAQVTVSEGGPDSNEDEDSKTGSDGRSDGENSETGSDGRSDGEDSEDGNSDDGEGGDGSADR
mgnify:CR=1 FL=1